MSGEDERQRNRDGDIERRLEEIGDRFGRVDDVEPLDIGVFPHHAEHRAGEKESHDECDADADTGLDQTGVEFVEMLRDRHFLEDIDTAIVIAQKVRHRRKIESTRHESKLLWLADGADRQEVSPNDAKKMGRQNAALRPAYGDSRGSFEFERSDAWAVPTPIARLLRSSGRLSSNLFTISATGARDTKRRRWDEDSLPIDMIRVRARQRET